MGELSKPGRAKALTNKITGKNSQVNTGTGRDGTFGAGTAGAGMKSNPEFRGPGNNKNYGLGPGK